MPISRGWQGGRKGPGEFDGHDRVENAAVPAVPPRRLPPMAVIPMGTRSKNGFAQL